MIDLYQFPALWGLPNFSPFCAKLETWLRMAGLPYQLHVLRLPARAPKGKLPYIVDGEQRIGDSSQAIDYLIATYGDRLDAHLSAAQRATALAFQRLLEESLYWTVLYSRWFDSANWPAVRQALFGDLPPGLRTLVPLLARSKLRRDILGHGYGRHTLQQLYAIGCRDLDALATQLGQQPYIMGEFPCSLDACVFGFAINLLWAPLDNPIKAHAQRYPQLDAYCRRMWAAYYSDRPLPPAAGK